MAANSDVINQALVHLGITEKIADINSTDSNEAEAIKRVYDNALAEVLREVDWSFARKAQTLALLSAVPLIKWQYQYSRPDDCIRFIRIDSGAPVDDEKSAVPFEEGWSELGPVILTNQPDAVGEFIVLVDDPTHWDALFTRMFALKIAVLTAPAVGRGDPFKITERCEFQYEKAKRKAVIAMRRERRGGPRPDSPMITERN